MDGHYTKQMEDDNENDVIFPFFEADNYIRDLDMDLIIK